ncbi:unnamed protein product [Acanthosepion pharaonis]|uniref:Uncharacterized protein n=1 Tax=Acanthosepion pharaonis TaxID=158019 RepID=A0A812CPI6_ACAPH|nr:unnamed protein product [Sepia pharaonis]
MGKTEILLSELLYLFAVTLFRPLFRLNVNLQFSLSYQPLVGQFLVQIHHPTNLPFSLFYQLYVAPILVQIHYPLNSSFALHQQIYLPVTLPFFLYFLSFAVESFVAIRRSLHFLFFVASLTTLGLGRRSRSRVLAASLGSWSLSPRVYNLRVNRFSAADARRLRSFLYPFLFRYSIVVRYGFPLVVLPCCYRCVVWRAKLLLDRSPIPTVFQCPSRLEGFRPAANVRLATPLFITSLDEPPQPLRYLLLGTTSESTHFLEAIRKYNCCFQMTSFGAKAISEGRWLPTFKVQAQVYHLLRSLLADEGEPPQFLQIYFLADYNDKVDARLGILPSAISVGPRKDILFRLQDMLHKSNTYIRSLKSALQNNSLPSFSVVIDADRWPHGEHERRFNAPACNEVAAVIHGEKHNSRDIVIWYRGDVLHRISETHRSYDCLQYPLLLHTEGMGTTSKSQYTRQAAIPCRPQRRSPVRLTMRTRVDAVRACLKSSALWRPVETLKLST